MDITNLFNNNNCQIINIIWIDRGIILTIIYYILKYYKKLLNKNIIINNYIYRKFVSRLFPKLSFNKFKSHNVNNFYFNIRETIKEQDIFIDYLKNYNKYINTDNIKLVPWYDINDPLIAYKYTKSKMDIIEYKIFINQKFICKRGNYHNTYWDIYVEYDILNKYCLFSSINFNYLYTKLNDHLYKYYIHVKNINIVEKPVIYYKENVVENTKEVKIENKNNIDDLLKVMTNKINKINNLI